MVPLNLDLFPQACYPPCQLFNAPMIGTSCLELCQSSDFNYCSIVTCLYVACRGGGINWISDFSVHVHVLPSVNKFSCPKMSLNSQMQSMKTMSRLSRACIEHLKGSNISFYTFLKYILQYQKMESMITLLKQPSVMIK